MILRLYRSNRPVLALLLPIIGLILWLPSVWLRQLPDFSISLLTFLPFESNAAIFLWTFIAFILVLTATYLFNNLFQSYELISRRNQLPGLCYLIAFSWSPLLLHYSHVLAGQIFILLAIRRMMGIYRQHNVVRELYDIGLFLGIAAAIYAPFILFIPGCWFCISVLRPFSLREYLTPLLGILTVLLLCAGMDFVLDGQVLHHLEANWYPVEGLYPVGLFGWFKYLIASVLLLMTIVAAPSFIAALARSTMRDRNLKLILLIFGLNTLALFILFTLLPPFGFNVMLLAFPVSLMLVYAVADKAVNWTISALFYLLIVSAVINNYGMLWTM